MISQLLKKFEDIDMLYNKSLFPVIDLQILLTARGYDSEQIAM